MTLNVKAGDEVMIDRGVWARVTGPAYIAADGAEVVPIQSRGTVSMLPFAVLSSFVLRIRKAEEVVARELMR